MNVNIRLVVGMLLLFLTLAGCASPQAAPPAATTPAEDVPTEAAASTDDLAEPVDDMEPDPSLEGRLSFKGSTTVQPLVEKLGEEYIKMYPNVELDVAAGGSVVGIQAVQNGDVDVGMCSRELREGEQTSGMEVHRIAVDVLAVIVHPDNPVDDLTREELKGIYTGEITNWSEVGGEDEEILAVIREETSGTRGAFDEIALEDEPNRSDADVQITAGEVEQRVATTPNAIGYVGFGHVDPVIKVLNIDDVAPSPETATDGSYQLQRPLLLLTGPLSQELSSTFVDFALSPAGQQIVEEDGWVAVQ
ncbi:MAG: phosphate ABC transporter substrate-binding protein [Chloroflexaceae bacterium]|nr:phosphate ABC transporter substrate-binding protein [Chloroflexaceae bacterium]